MQHDHACAHANQSKSTSISCWTGAEGLLVSGSTAPACLVQLSAAQHGRALAAGVRQLSQQPGQLLCAAPASGTTFTALYRHGASLRLYTLPASSGEPQLLAEFEHEGFADLDAPACQVLPGVATMVLLQPEPWGLLVLQLAAVPLQSPLPAWQSLDLQLPAVHLLEAAAQTYPSVQVQLLSMCNSSSLSSLAAAAPWRLLHSQCGRDEEAGGLQLLLVLPLAGAGQKQQALLLLMLHVNTMPGHSEAAAAAAADEGGASMSVVWCHALDWPLPPSCAVVFERADSQVQQLVAVGSQTGDVHIFSSSSKVSPTAQLGGAVQSILHLPHAVVAGSSQHDMLAVLHVQQPASISGRASNRQGQDGSMAVSLLKLQEGGGQLQELAVVQGVLGLGVPPAQAPLGLLCPQQPAPPLQQQQSFAARADSHAVQLAAVIVLDSSTTDTQDSQWSGAATAGLGQHAWLGPGQADGLPGPLLGILAAPAQSTPQAAGSAPASDAAAVAAASAGDAAEQAAGSSNELHGLRSMLAVLEQRWQQETRELYGLQQRVTAAQRLAAAGHKMLCQMAADTLHRSGIRQYVLPLGSMQPGGALAVYHAGRQLAEQQQQQQQQEQAPSQGSSELGATQLLLQVVSISTALQDGQLQLQVCVRPELHAENKHLAVWSGALLQPCHAELLVWHASHPGVTSNSEWSWDAISGQLTITCSQAVDLLLQLHSLNGSTSGTAQPGHSNSQQAAAGIAGGEHLEAGQAQLAHVLAAAAEQVAGGTHERSSRSSSSQQVAQGTEAIQLQVAVAVSARCSSQAVVQHEARQPFQQQHALLVGQRARLLAPALALLHLQPLQVSTQDLLVHQLTSSTPLDAGRPVSAHPAAAAGVKAGDQVTAQTPVRASKQAGAAEHGRRSSMGLPAGASEVVPPTPCSADDGFEGELGVIPDSQEGQEGESEQQQEPHERRQQLQQWWQSQQQRQQASGLSGPEHANGAAAAAVGAEGMDWEAAQSSDRDDVLSAHAGSLPAAGRSKQLMLQSPHVDLQLVPTALLRMQCFQTIQEGSQHLQLALQPARSPHAPVLQGQDGPVGSGGGVLDFVSLGPHQLHVTVYAPSQHSLGCLEQLLLLAVRQLPGDVGVQASCLDSSLLGRLTAATHTLADATHLHVKVIEDILQQLPATMTRPRQRSTAGTTSAEGTNHCAHQGQGAQLMVDGSPVSAEVSQCWLSCLKAQADVDLALVRLQ